MFVELVKISGKIFVVLDTKLYSTADTVVANSRASAMGYTIDSPLSTTSSVAGILTFVVAIAATVYVRFTYLRNADQEYFRVKASLSWYKTESTWMNDLIHAADGPRARSGS